MQPERAVRARADDTTIVTCIEAGGLEGQVILLARSLRQLGGRYADTPLVAVKARRGPPITRATRRALATLDVRIVDEVLNGRKSWWAHANKPAALVWADRYADTGYVTWMDSDMLFLREPDAFVPPDGCDFMARAGEACDVASTGDDDQAAFWHAVCAHEGLAFDRFPMILSFPDDRMIRAYWQAGIFTFRRGIGFPDVYRTAMATLLDGAIGSKKAGVYHTDQVALALAVQRAGVTVAEYAPTMNLNLNHKDPETFSRFPIEQVKIVHYHGSFWPERVGWALDRMTGLTAAQRATMDGLVPLASGNALVRAHRKLYEAVRARSVRAYEARVRLI